jgi:hypothetical protein
LSPEEAFKKMNINKAGHGRCCCLQEILITLNMGFPNKILPHYTYEDYCRWEGQWELIDGIPYAMSPMPRPQHQK